MDVGIIVGVALIVGVIGGAWLSARGGELADIEIRDEAVVVTMRGLNKIWAMKGRLEIPLERITSAAYVPDARVLARGLRLPGTAIPGVMIAGTYLARGQRAFYAMHRGENGLVIDIDGWKYQQVIVDTKDPDALASQIEEAAGVP